MARHLVIEIERRIFSAPGVVFPVDKRRRQSGAGEKHRAMITRPNVVGWNVMDGNVRHFADEIARLSEYLLASGKNMNRLEFSERAHILCPNRWDRLELSWPGFRLVRPGKPRGGVRFPLRGKAVTERGG